MSPSEGALGSLSLKCFTVHIKSLLLDWVISLGLGGSFVFYVVFVGFLSNISVAILVLCVEQASKVIATPRSSDHS